MEIKYTLKAVNSKADIYGNRYYSFVFTELNTGKQVKATISGGESNIYGIKRHWDVDGWDESIYFSIEELKIREYNKLYKNMPYAGCESKDIAEYIKKELNK